MRREYKVVRIEVFVLILSHGLFAMTSESQSIHQPPDSTQQFDPATGLLVPVEVPEEPVTGFDPETGLPIQAPAVGTQKPVILRQPRAEGGPSVSRVQLRSRAVADARRNYQGSGLAWGILGGGFTMAGALAGGIWGTTILDFPGFLIGTTVGGITATALITGFVKEVSVPADIQKAGQTSADQYTEHYNSELKRLRRRSIWLGLGEGQ